MRNKRLKRIIRARRVRKTVKGSISIPRMSVFRSNKHIFAQIIDDTKDQTLVSYSDLKLKKDSDRKHSKIDNSQKVGLNLANLALKKNIKKIVFDRGGYKYHGRVKALAEGARKGGLIF